MYSLIMNNPDENAKIVIGHISVVLRGRDLKFWERSEKNNILTHYKLLPNCDKCYFPSYSEEL